MSVFRSVRSVRSLAVRRVAVAGSLVMSVAAFAVPAAGASAGASAGHRLDDDVVVVANRGSGDVSVIGADSLEVETFDLPGDAEPMYVSHDRRRGRVLVGDRASGSVVALDDESFAVVGSVDVGAGVFHQWLDQRRDQLWVVGDTSNSVTVVDAGDLEVRATIELPAELATQGGRPHDVFVSGRHAFVSMLGFGDGSGVVLRYSTRTFAETGRIATGGDPHLYMRRGTLFVASQDASTVTSYRAATLHQVASAEVPSAHGIWVTRRGEVLVTNIAGGGDDAVWELGRRLHPVAMTDTSVPVPHNLVELDGDVFVTHSGATANQVSVIEHGRGAFGDGRTVTVGANPFGLAVVDR